MRKKNKMRKSLVTLLLTGAVVMGLAGCNEDREYKSSENSRNLITVDSDSTADNGKGTAKEIYWDTMGAWDLSGAFTYSGNTVTMRDKVYKQNVTTSFSYDSSNDSITVMGKTYKRQ